MLWIFNWFVIARFPNKLLYDSGEIGIFLKIVEKLFEELVFDGKFVLTTEYNRESTKALSRDISSII